MIYGLSWSDWIKKKKKKIINFWTWFDKNYSSFIDKLIEDEKKKIIEDFVYYELIRYPPNSNPPRHHDEPLKLIFTREVMS